MQDVPRFEIQELRKHLFKLLDLPSSNFCLLENGGKRRVRIQTQSTLSGAEMVLSQRHRSEHLPMRPTIRAGNMRADTDPRRRRVGCVHMLIHTA